MGSSPMKEIHEYIAGEVVHIFVGPKRKQYIVHKGLICDKSTYFASAFEEDRFKEGIEKEMYLPEDSPQAFDLFVRWLYTSHLDSKGICPDLRPSNKSNVGDKNHGPCWSRIEAAIFLYALADKICLEGLKNLVMHNIKALLNSHSFGPTRMAKMGKAIPDNSPLRKFAARKSRYKIQDSGKLIGFSDEVWKSAIRENQEFVIDILHAFSDGDKNRPGGGTGKWNPTNDSDCEYHEHNITPKCADASGN